jgi:hypothetical protein
MAKALRYYQRAIGVCRRKLIVAQRDALISDGYKISGALLQKSCPPAFPLSQLRGIKPLLKN